MSRSTIEINARLIESLAATITDGDWATSTAQKCAMIEKALEEIRKELAPRYGGER